MQEKVGYKITESGLVPEAWTVSTIGMLCNAVLDCHHSTPVWTDSGAVVIRNQNIRDGRLDLSESSFTNEKHYLERTRRAVPTFGDLVITREAPMGLVCRIPQGLKCCLGQRMVLLRPNSNILNSDYFLRTLGSDRVQRAISVAGGTGSTVSNLRIPALRDLKIPVPPMREQRAIAEALSDVDELITSLDRLIAKKRDVKQGAMQQLLTGKTRLPGFTGQWETRQLGQLAKIKTGSRNNEDKNPEGHYPFFVRSEVVERIDSWSYDCEAILVPGEGRIGSIFHYIKGRFDVHQRVYAITDFEPKTSARFVHALMRQTFGDWAMMNTVKATVDSLRLPTFLTFRVTLPPTLAEQSAIANVISDMDAELAALEARRDKTKLLKQGMMQELLTGKTRLV